MDQHLGCCDSGSLMCLFKTHKDCVACSSARLFFEPGTQLLKALQLTLGWTDRTGEIANYLNSSSNNLELSDRISELLTDLKPMRAKKIEAFVAGTAPRQFQKHMWQFLLGLATVTEEQSAAEIGSPVGCGADPIRCRTVADLSKTSFWPMVASTPMLAVPAAPPSSTFPRGKAAKCLFQADDKCPGSETVDSLAEAESTLKQRNPRMSKYESCLGGLLTSSEGPLATNVQGGRSVPVSHASLEATLSHFESKLETLRQHLSSTATTVELSSTATTVELSSTATIVAAEEMVQERLPSAAQLGEVRYAVCRLGRATEQLLAALAPPQADGQRRLTLSAQEANDFAAAVMTIERALMFLAALKGLKGK